MSDKWKDHAECIGLGPIMQGGADGKTWSPARRICATCKDRRPDVHAACAEAGKTESAGMWAGLAPYERGFKLSGKTAVAPIRVYCRACGAPFQTAQPHQLACSARCSVINRGRTPKDTTT